MSVVLARVDSRLVHGQVLEAWVPLLRAEVLLVVDSELVSDPLQQMLVQGYARSSLDVRLVSPEEARDQLAGSLACRRVLLLFPGVAQALEAHRAGVAFDRLNLGNVHPRDASRPVTRSVYLTDDDRAALCELVARGVAVEARAIPADRSPSEAVLCGTGAGGR